MAAAACYPEITFGIRIHWHDFRGRKCANHCYHTSQKGASCENMCVYIYIVKTVDKISGTTKSDASSVRLQGLKSPL